MKVKFAVIVYIFLLRCHLVTSNLEAALLQSLEKAMLCTHRGPPTEPVLAMSPKRYSQMVALLKKNVDTPICDTNQPVQYFNVEDENTWPFCVFGTCYQNQCQCLHTYTGLNCATYYRRCWVMYCYLSGCDPAQQSLYCKCDPQMYGQPVLSGDYWYDEGLYNEFRYPPPGWQDDAEEQSYQETANMYYGSDQNSGVPSHPKSNWAPDNSQPNSGQWPPQQQANSGSSWNQPTDARKPEQYEKPQKVNLQKQENSGSSWNQPTNAKVQKQYDKPQKVSPQKPNLSADKMEDSTEDIKKALDEVEAESSASLTTSGMETVFVIVISCVLFSI